MTIAPGTLPTAQLHQYLLGAVSPRPICFASTINAEGQANLSPYSFFNVFGSNPATLVFSPSRRVRDNTIKHTLENIYQNGEVVINVVNYAMVQQASLSSCEYPKEVDEFIKAGFTKLASEKVKPYRVAESPVQMECTVQQVLETGTQGGAGNLVICQVQLMHINDAVLNEQGQIDPHKIDLVARMGLDYYCRASGAAVFEVPKPNTQLGMGFDALPPSIKNSRVLTGNHLGMLANVTTLPQPNAAFTSEQVRHIVQYYAHTPDDMETELHRYAAQLLDAGQVADAWQVLLMAV
ncbi:MAG TPA: flavin reductase family protein [Phnomibacter sp.]|nr:flavin reductase family protein [Phnomibacter sp.]